MEKNGSRSSLTRGFAPRTPPVAVSAKAVPVLQTSLEKMSQVFISDGENVEIPIRGQMTP